jgi:hypothetical protein
MTPASTDRATRYRGEGRPKRRLSPSPPPPKTPAPKSSPPKKSASKPKEAAASSNKAAPAKKKPRTPTPEEESEDEVLPSSFKSGQPFPTIRDRQPKDLPLRTYKSIAERYALNSLALANVGLIFEAAAFLVLLWRSRDRGGSRMGYSRSFG